MQVNKSFSVRGSAVVDVPVCYTAIIRGGNRVILQLRTERPASETILPNGYNNRRVASIFEKLAINMDPHEAASLGRLILGDDDPLIRLATVIADYDPEKLPELSSVIYMARLALGRELKS